MHRTLLLAVLSLSVLLSTLVAAQEASYTFTIIDPPDAISTTPTGINARGQIVGSYSTGTTFPPPSHGFLLEKGSFTPLDVPDATSTTAEGINARGQIVGSYTTGTGFPFQSHGFLFEEGAFTPLDVPDATSTTPTGINARGQIVGTFRAGNGAIVHGFLATPERQRRSRP